MLAHFTALTKTPGSKLPKPTGAAQANQACKSQSLRGLVATPDSGSLDKNGVEHEYDVQQAYLNGELETLRHRHGDDHSYDFATRHLRPTSIQTMNSYISSSSHTTNTNSAPSPGLAQLASPSLNFVRSRESLITSEIIESPPSSVRSPLWASQKTPNQSHSRSLSFEENSACNPNLLFPTARSLFRSPSNSGFSMRHKVLPTDPHQKQLEAQPEQSRLHLLPKLHEESNQSGSKPAQRYSNASLRYNPDKPIQLDKPIQPRSLPVSARSASQPRVNRYGLPTELGTRYSTPRSSRTMPKSAGQPTFTSAPTPAPTFSQTRNFTSPVSNSRHHQAAVSRPPSSSGGSASGRPPSILSSATERHVASHAPSHKRQSVMETPSATPAPLTASAGPPLVAAQAHRLSTRISAATGSASNLRKAARLGIQRQPPKEEASLPSNTLTDIHTPQVQTNSLPPNPLPSTGHPPVGYNCNLKASVGEERGTLSARIPTRQESTEELVQYLERLIGYDDLRLLVNVDKLRHLCNHSNTEGGKAGAANLYQSQSNRKSNGNGFLGRLGWKHKRVSSSEKNKLLHRNGSVNSDRRGTFGLWGSGQSRSTKSAVLGCPLEESDAFSCVTVIGGQKHLIPIIIFSLIEEIYARGMRTPGFMRIAGKIEKIDALAEVFERAPVYGDGIDLSGEDIHVLCSLFKRYLRALPEPLMSRELFHILWSHCVRQPVMPDKDNLQNTISTSQCLMRLMPPRSFSLFIYVVAFLSQIPLFPQNKFSLAGIAKVFGPALFSARTQRKGVDERPMHALKWLLENWSLITEGLLDEYFTVKFPGRPSSHDFSDAHPEPFEINSPSRPVDSPIAPDNLSQHSNCNRWIPANLNSQLSRSVALLDWQTQSLLRNSLSSAQHIVDRYEAKEKALVEVHSTSNETDAAESHSEAYETVSAPSITDPSAVPKSERPCFPLTGIAEVTDPISLSDIDSHNDEPTAISKQNTPRVPSVGIAEATDSVLPTANDRQEEKSSGRAAELGNLRESTQTLTHSLKRSILVLNEPPELARPATEPLILAKSLPEVNKTRNSVITQGVAFNPHVTKILQLNEIEENTTQNFKGITSDVKLDHDDTANPVESVVRKTLLMIERHQTLLSDMRSQLNELLLKSLQTVQAQTSTP